MRAKISSHRGPTIRSSNSPAEVDLHPRRGERRSVEPDSAAHSRAGLFIRRSAWLRLQPVRAQLARHSAGAPAIRAARGFLEDFAVENRQSLGRGAPAVDHPLRGVDPGKSAQPHGALHHHGGRSAELRPPRAQPLEHGVSIAGGVHGYGRPAADVDGRPRRIHRPSRIAGRAGGPPRPGSIVQQDRRRVGPLRRDAGEIHATARRGERVRARSGTGGIEGGGSRPARRAIAARSRCAVEDRDGLLGPDIGRRSSEDAGPVDGCASERLAAVPNARVPALGAYAPSTSRAAPTDFAINCRT